MLPSLTYSAAPRLECDLYLPVQENRAPVVVQLFGGGWRSGQRGERFAVSASLAAAGFASLAIDYRLAPAHAFPAQLRDLERALAFLRDRPEVDASRVALMGISAGGHLAAVGAMTLAPKVRCAVCFHAPFDLVEYARYDLENPTRPAWAQGLVRDLVGTLDDAAVRRASPYHLVSPHAAPLLAICSAGDGSVPYAAAERTVAALTKVGVASAFFLHPSAAHVDVDPDELRARGWAQIFSAPPPPRLMFHDQVIAFLRTHLATGRPT